MGSSSFARRLAIRWAVSLVALSPALPAASAEVLPEISGAVVSREAFPERRISFPGGVTSLPDVTYASRLGFRPLMLDLYLPPATFKDKGPRPFVVYVHGGGWLAGSRRTTGAFASWPEALASIAARGYVVASIDYRLAREAPFPAAIHDVKDAVRWLRGNADAYGIDRRRGLIWGSSAGGQLAALAATTCDVKALDDPAPAATANAAVDKSTPPPAAVDACLQGAVVWYGITDFAPLGSMREAAEFLACEGDRCAEVRRVASPVTYVNEKSPPFLVVHGTEDRTVPVQQARALHEALKTRGRNPEVLLLVGIDHGFLGTTPEATRDASLQAWRRTVAFIERILGEPERR